MVGKITAKLCYYTCEYVWLYGVFFIHFLPLRPLLTFIPLRAHCTRMSVCVCVQEFCCCCCCYTHLHSIFGWSVFYLTRYIRPHAYFRIPFDAHCFKHAFDLVIVGSEREAAQQRQRQHSHINWKWEIKGTHGKEIAGAVPFLACPAHSLFLFSFQVSV